MCPVAFLLPLNYDLSISPPVYQIQQTFQYFWSELATLDDTESKAIPFIWLYSHIVRYQGNSLRVAPQVHGTHIAECTSTELQQVFIEAKFRVLVVVAT